ncbi:MULTISPECIES: EAL domain-containing protein [unclassified Pseudoalteromonas]|uniref:EAL domain-containing response regulator n=1 Tax=unclassified Pseudoalteromonas TaxID=194690 RepID=UPI0020BE5266|nr:MULTISPECIES: EAL domain-containing protein [unclassified Pseudoalteromonas]MCK8095293.1 EAL domain-containing protein [Pseudoalteromonas sp. 1CM17D]MCK8103100.1 EAL domain-containing protein [Pseudoalteromonas sp. 2CM36K]MCK8136866.1 EAL domain-containing protein [Pseudoalteromonas sp. 2CM28B]
MKSGYMAELCKILVIDDEEINTLQLEHVLDDVGVICSCNKSEDAIALIEEFIPDILLLDLEMPNVSGFDILLEIQKRPHLVDLRVLVITSHNDPEIEQKALSFGAIDFISKPLNLTLCRMRVENHAKIRIQEKTIQRTKAALAAEKEHLRITLDSIADGVISTDEHACITYLNPVAQRLTGWSQIAARGRHIEEVMILRDTSTKIPSINPLSVALKENRPVAMAINTQLISRQGMLYRVEDSAAPILDKDGNKRGAVMVFQDVSEVLAMSVQMTYLSHHDQLTALPNRVLLHDRLTQGIARASFNNTKVSLLLLDLDKFKYINDALGHHIGDEIIAHIGHSLDKFACNDITVARVGGDEFALVVPYEKDTFGLEPLVSQVLDVIAKPFRLADEQHVLSASLGISVYPDDASSVEEMLRHADSAMYKAKQEGANSYYYFSHDLQVEMTKRLKVGNCLRNALDNNDLVVLYQPKYDLVTNDVIGAEGLVRLKDDTGEFISPLNFIEYAEESGLIYRLGEQVLEQSCIDAKKWLDAGYPKKVAVNISAKQFTGISLVDTVASILEKTKLPSRYLELEVTESALIDNFEQTIKQLQAIADMGISLALDDFGTGYSSLSYLRLFPLDVLKIDQSFVRDMLTDSQSLDIVIAIIDLANSLNLQIVAEGIETSQQREKLQSLGCAIGQGYLLGKPMPFLEMMEVLTQAKNKGNICT